MCHLHVEAATNTPNDEETRFYALFGSLPLFIHLETREVSEGCSTHEISV